MEKQIKIAEFDEDNGNEDRTYKNLLKQLSEYIFNFQVSKGEVESG